MPAADGVQIQGLRAGYGRRGEDEVLRDVDLAAPSGRLTVVAGPSGSGKSTLLRVVAGLHRAGSGAVVVDGVDVDRLSSRARRRHRRRAIGMVLQRPSDNLLEELTAVEQVQLAARLRGAGCGEAPALLAVVGLADRAGSRPHELSGGEQQRVAFAAAAVGSPRVVLADEPTAQLDRIAGRSLIDAMLRLVDGGTTLLVASHDDEVIDAAHHVLRLRDGEVVG